MVAAERWKKKDKVMNVPEGGLEFPAARQEGWRGCGQC
jgi:hypothetical protein